MFWFFQCIGMEIHIKETLADVNLSFAVGTCIFKKDSVWERQRRRKRAMCDFLLKFLQIEVSTEQRLEPLKGFICSMAIRRSVSRGTWNLGCSPSVNHLSVTQGILKVRGYCICSFVQMACYFDWQLSVIRCSRQTVKRHKMFSMSNLGKHSVS